MVKYEVFIWNPLRKQYVRSWSGHDYDRALIMFHKPYNSRTAAKLVRTETTTLEVKHPRRRR